VSQKFWKVPMEEYEWLWSGWAPFGTLAIKAVVTYAALLALTRIAGLRSYAKFSSYDFPIVVAIGSAASVVFMSETPPLLQSLWVLGIIFALHLGVSLVQQYVPSGARLVNNPPILLMVGPQIIDEHMSDAHITRDELRAKLREANAVHPDDIIAVVFETTGDVSVLWSREEGPVRVDPELLEDVEGSERLRDFLASHDRFVLDEVGLDRG
jgi:uncharacterized membrane protein YcaP (DUF421 family)